MQKNAKNQSQNFTIDFTTDINYKIYRSYCLKFTKSQKGEQPPCRMLNQHEGCPWIKEDYEKINSIYKV